MLHVLSSQTTEDYNDYVELGHLKIGIGNDPIITDPHKLEPPALVAHARGNQNGRILYKNLWIESALPFVRSSRDWFWKKYEEEYEKHIDREEYSATYEKLFTYSDLHFYVSYQGLLYDGSWAYVEEVTREKVLFKDGSTVTGELAQKIYYKHEEMRNNRIHYLKTSENHFAKYNDLVGKQIYYVKFEGERVEACYNGSGSLLLSSYTLPIINHTPFMMILAQAYSTVTCGWANHIRIHPGNTLRRTRNGGPLRFAIWRERPTHNDDIGTILEYDQEHSEVIQWRKSNVLH